MKNSWTRTFRRLAAACTIGGATAFASAMSYAATLAFDTATDAAYDDGWQAGDNGGFGFGPWNFDGTFTNNPAGGADLPDQGNQQTTDIFSAPNDLGRAWTMFNHNGSAVGTPNPPQGGTDISRAGRAIPGALQPGDTIHVVIDNPTERRFFRGYTLRFNTGGANICYGGDNCSTPAFDPGSVTTRMAVGTFEYFTYGKWFSTDGSPTLFDTDTHHGLRVDFTLTGANTFNLKMTPLDNPAISYSDTGTLNGTGPINWVQLEFYNTDSDYHPSAVTPAGETDFYASNMWITPVPEPGTCALLLLGTGVMVGIRGFRSRKE
jgi:hypothetical protein